MHRLFVSDLHLSDDTPDIEEAFTGLLKQESPLDSLVLLGDVFEAWVGDDDDSPLANRVKSVLRALAESGTEILFTRGNRDFMLGEQFASDIGGTLLPDQTVLDVAGHPTLVLHGDTLCTDDVDYQQLGFEAKLKLPKDHLYALGLDRGCSSRSSAAETPDSCVSSAVATCAQNLSRHAKSSGSSSGVTLR